MAFEIAVAVRKIVVAGAWTGLADSEREHTGYVVEEKMTGWMDSLVLVGHMLNQRHHTVEAPTDSSRLEMVLSGVDSVAVAVVGKEEHYH